MKVSRKGRGFTLAEVMFAIAIIAIYSVPLIFTAQKCFNHAEKEYELTQGYFYCQELMERAVNLASDPDNWGTGPFALDPLTGIGGDPPDEYYWCGVYEYTYTNALSGAAPPTEYQLPDEVRPSATNTTRGDVIYVSGGEDRNFCSRIDMVGAPLPGGGGGFNQDLVLVTVSVYHVTPGSATPTPDTSRANGGLVARMSTLVSEP